MDSPFLHAPGVDPFSVLVIGGGAAVGYGVSSWELSLGGHLGRQLATATAHGIDVEIVPDPEITSANAHRHFAGGNVSRFDSILLVLGPLEALLLVSPRRWARQLTRLVEHIESALPRGTRVFLPEIRDFDQLVWLPRVLLRAANRNARAFNEATEEVVRDRRSIVYIPLGLKTHDIKDSIDRRTYAELAALLIGPMSAGLLSKDRLEDQPEDQSIDG